MQRNTLGNTGISVSKLCFGTLTMSPLQRNMSPVEGAKLLIHAYERGMNFLDTADLYETYPHIREALKVAKNYVISTKAYCWDEETTSAALERAYRGLGRDYIDIFMLHEQESLYTLRGHEEALNYLVRQKENGHIGAVGISTHYAGCVAATTRFPQIEIVHPLINKDGIGIQDGTREDMEQAIIRARADGKGIFAMKPLGGGHLMSDNRAALRYARENPLFDSVAMGMQSIREIDANIDFFDGIEEDPTALQVLSERKRTMMVHDYCEGCGRCAARCGQHAISICDGHAVIDPEKCVFCGYCARVCPQFCIKVV